MSNSESAEFLASGRFMTGCNYWASHAGTAMWSDWRADVVEEDMKQLSGAGLQVLRVFPLWPDFQPLHLLRGGGGTPREFRHGEVPLADDEVGQAGMSETALEHFAEFADLAERYGLKLSVGLITGWMSGRLFVPPALEGRPLHTDPVALMWQVRFIRCFVQRFRNHPAIAAWGPGNECNCLGGARNREEAWNWTALITQTIRNADPSRPIISGMHSLKPVDAGTWTIQDQAEWTDMLTTHPYPIFTPKCDQDPINTIRSCLHATAESCLYADVGQVPCMVEEIGTLGPMICSEEVSAAYIRTVLLSAWAHDCRGLFWWCAYDQLHLTHAPYDWNSVERELGLVRSDRSPKPVLKAVSEFQRFIDELPLPALPPRLTDAVCILTRGQDHWAAAYSSFILAKQANLELVFQTDDQPLREAPLYIVPSATGGSPFSRHQWLELLRRVKEDGATLLVTCNDALLSPFNESFGLDVVSRERRNGPAQIALGTIGDETPLVCHGPVRLNLAPTTADVLLTEEDGNPVFTRNAYGKGAVFFFAMPLELDQTNTPRAFDRFPNGPAYRIYDRAAEGCRNEQRIARKDDLQVGLTEHILADGERVVILVNYSPETREPTLVLADGWGVLRPFRGTSPYTAPESGNATVRIPPNDAAVLLVGKSSGEKGLVVVP